MIRVLCTGTTVRHRGTEIATFWRNGVGRWLRVSGGWASTHHLDAFTFRCRHCRVDVSHNRGYLYGMLDRADERSSPSIVLKHSMPFVETVPVEQQTIRPSLDPQGPVEADRFV